MMSSFSSCLLLSVFSAQVYCQGNPNSVVRIPLDPTPNILRGSLSDADRKEIREAILANHNRFRKEEKVGSLVLSQKLSEKAQLWADNQGQASSKQSRPLHQSDASQRAILRELGGYKLGENIAWGEKPYPTRQWRMSKEGHRENMLVKDFTHAGFGIGPGQEPNQKFVIVGLYAAGLSNP